MKVPEKYDRHKNKIQRFKTFAQWLEKCRPIWAKRFEEYSENCNLDLNENEFLAIAVNYEQKPVAVAKIEFSYSDQDKTGGVQYKCLFISQFASLYEKRGNARKLMNGMKNFALQKECQACSLDVDTARYKLWKKNCQFSYEEREAGAKPSKKVTNQIFVKVNRLLAMYYRMGFRYTLAWSKRPQNPDIWHFDTDPKYGFRILDQYRKHFFGK